MIIHHRGHRGAQSFFLHRQLNSVRLRVLCGGTFIYKPIYQRDDEQADQRSYRHSPDHRYGKRLLQLRAHVEREQQRHHGKDGGERRHDDGPEPSAPRLMDGFEQRHACSPQLIDGIQFQDGVVDDDTARHNQSDGGHQVQRMPANP